MDWTCARRRRAVVTTSRPSFPACCACLDALPPSKQRGLYRVPGDNAEVSRVRDALDASRTFEDALRSRSKRGAV